MITILDYGLGNIRAFVNIYKSLGIDCVVAHDIQTLNSASRLILPGVGSFDWAIKKLETSGFRPTLDNLVLSKYVPILGVCVGMQMMALRSDEGILPGLGWIPGDVKMFDENYLNSISTVPHIGWNDVVPIKHPLFSNILDPRFYFLHSYHFIPHFTSQVLAETEYGHCFVSAVFNQNIIGVQFHPEKSHHWGAKLLENFAQIEF